MASVAQALSAIRARAIAAGHHPTDAQVLATYNRDIARGNSIGHIITGSTAPTGGTIGGVSTPIQGMTPSSSGPAASGTPTPLDAASGVTTGTGSGLTSGLGAISPNVLLLGGAAILVILLLRRK